MKYQLAIFDMDGTILDTIEDLADTMNYCLRKFQMPERTLAEIRSFVGNGIHNLVEKAVPAGTGNDAVEAIFQCFREYYKDHCAIKTKPYTGICEVLAALKSKGIKTAVVSNKADFAVKMLCDNYFKGLFDISVGDREGQRRKPFPDSVNYVMDFFGVTPAESVYIGDSEVDFQTANNAGVDVIMVGWGFREEQFLRSIGVTKVIHKPEELKELFCSES
ncbi:MAG: HAD family hydrolase [Lachnospiraceae bacterium]